MILASGARGPGFNSQNSPPLHRESSWRAALPHPATPPNMPAEAGWTADNTSSTRNERPRLLPPRPGLNATSGHLRLDRPRRRDGGTGSLGPRAHKWGSPPQAGSGAAMPTHNPWPGTSGKRCSSVSRAVCECMVDRPQRGPRCESTQCGQCYPTDHIAASCGM